MDDIIDSVNQFVYNGIGSLENALQSTPPERLGFKAANPTDGSHSNESEYPEARQEIEEGLHKLETLFNSTLDRNFDKFELYALTNLFSVHADLVNWIRLGHYEGITYPLPQDAPTPEAIELLRRKVAASRNVSRLLTTEHNRNEAMLTRLRAMLDPKSEDDTAPNVSFLAGFSPQHALPGQQPLTTNTKFALSQIPALKSTLTELKAKLATLQDVPLTIDSVKDERREERRGYIEQRTKLHIEKNSQTASNAGPLSGKQADTSEVEALEKVANLFNPP